MVSSIGSALLLMGVWTHQVPPLQASEVQTVEALDLNRYQGLWYEMARYPFKMQEGCVGSTATYTLNQSGEIEVINRCFDESFDGPVREARGKARRPDEDFPGQLQVSFSLFMPWADYWVLEIGENYSYSVVGNPERKFLWILSRTPQMDLPLYQDILGRLEQREWDTSKLIRTPQQGHKDSR